MDHEKRHDNQVSLLQHNEHQFIIALNSSRIGRYNVEIGEKRQLRPQLDVNIVNPSLVQNQYEKIDITCIYGELYDVGLTCNVNVVSCNVGSMLNYAEVTYDEINVISINVVFRKASGK